MSTFHNFGVFIDVFWNDISSVFFDWPFNSSSHWAEISSATSLAVSRLFPNIASSTCCALFPLASHKTLRTAIAFRDKVIWMILQEIFICCAMLTSAVFQNCSYLAWNATACKKLLHIIAFRFRNGHNCLRLLVVSKSTSDHNWILKVLKEMQSESLSPR